MAFPTSEVDKMMPNNISDIGLRDEDSGLRLFRGMMSPWDQIKSFKETYTFLIRHAALIAVGYMDSMRIVMPSYEASTTAMAEAWGIMQDYAWVRGGGSLEAFEERFDVPPFLKEGVIRAAIYADKGDEHMLLPGHIWYATNDRVEKEIHGCPIDIAGPEACDLSLGGGSHFCRGVACMNMNNYDPERIGCGDDYCVAIMESNKKYGEHKNSKDGVFDSDNHEWEVWGPSASGYREKHMPRKPECEFLNTGVFVAPTGATWTAGEMYKDCNMWPFSYSFNAVDVIRNELSTEEMERALNTVDVMFDACGKFQFGEWNTRKAAREWMGVPADVDDGRVMGGYISMILQARDVEWKFLEFTAESTIVECSNRTKLAMMGMYPEFIRAYGAYFNGCVKTLVAANWVVTLEEDEDNDLVRFIIDKRPFGFRRQKPNLDNYEKNTEAK